MRYSRGIRVEGDERMRWQGRRGSGNIEDRRRMAGAPAIGGIGLVIIVLIGLFLGVDVTPLLNQGGVPIGGGGVVRAADEEAAQFVGVTLADTEDVWTGIFANQLGRQYRQPTLVLFKGVTQSPCGGASGATGPFYCPLDQKVYLDTDFFTTLERELGANGDFAAAYVVAHEVGHHVQNELGILGKTTEIRRQVSPAEANALSVRVELQADCFAGLWARAADEQLGTIERGDLEEAMVAARQIGDDTLQRNAGRVPQPHTFTHGTSEQRMRWFYQGYNSGELASCDTFSARSL
jgi:predicted metalloprotease